MIKEIYIRDENDPNYEPDRIEFSDEVESAITQLRMIIGTAPNEVLGSPNFGFELEDYIFTTKLSGGEITERLDEQLNNYLRLSNNIKMTIDISFGDSGKGWDYAILDVYINGKIMIFIIIVRLTPISRMETTDAKGKRPREEFIRQS